jgi:hypothetical protein
VSAFEPVSLWDLEERGQARSSDPPTSHAAAFHVRPGSARFALLSAHLDYPAGLTDEEAAVLGGLSLRSEYATRCSELERAGFLEPSTITRTGDSGLPRMVRRITDLGRHAVAR